MKFSIVTPSYNQLGCLKRCVRSVADQAGDIEHIIQDAGTGEELERWVREQPHTQLYVEPDEGIYDALNRGFRRATGDICSWLNCDEQYLPGSLQRVEAAFLEHPEAGIVVGDFLIVGDDGQLLSFRRATPLRASMILTDHLYDFTCAMFFRRRVFERGLWFRPDFRAAGDAEWICRVLASGVQITYVREYLATFAMTGENLSLRADPVEETQKLLEVTPRWARLAAPLLRQIRHFEKWLAGGYRSGPISYEIYAKENDEKRTRFQCAQPTWRHPWA